MTIKTLNITFTEEEFKKLEKVKETWKTNWHDLLINMILKEQVK